MYLINLRLFELMCIKQLQHISDHVVEHALLKNSHKQNSAKHISLPVLVLSGQFWIFEGAVVVGPDYFWMSLRISIDQYPIYVRPFSCIAHVQGDPIRLWTNSLNT